LIGVLALSSAWTGAAIDDKMSVAARAAPAPNKHLLFMEASIG
jgi:hypothetical protein